MVLGRKLYFVVAVNMMLLILGTARPSQAQWVRTGPAGGFADAFTASGPYLFVGTSSGIFRSSDSGTTWTQINTGLTDTIVTALGTMGTYLFAGTDTGGVFLSRDDGANWSPLLGMTNVFPVSSFASLDTAMFAATIGGGIFRTTDNGSSWLPVNNGLASDTVEALITDGNALISGTYTYGGVSRSTDYGATWVDISQGLSYVYVNSLRTIGSTLFAGTYGYGVYRSTNNGRSWVNPDTGLALYAYVYSLTAQGSTLFAGTPYGVFRSKDSAASWAPSNAGLRDSTAYALCTFGRYLFAATAHGVFRSADTAATWHEANNGIGAFNQSLTSPVSFLAAVSTTLYAGTSADSNGSIFLTMNDGNAWYTDTSLANNFVFAIESLGPDLFAGTDTGGVYRSTDGGAHWEPLFGLTNAYPVIAFGKIGRVLIATTQGGGIFRTTDAGTTWYADNNGITNGSPQTFATSGGSIFTGTSSGVFRSLDSGQTWIDVSQGLSGGNVPALAVMGPYLFAGASYGGVYRSGNNGRNWQYIDTGATIPDYINCFAVYDSDLFAGTSYGVFLSRDSGLSWTAVDSGLFTYYYGAGYSGNIHDLRVLDGYIFAATDSGVWRRALSDFPAGQKAGVRSGGNNSILLTVSPNPASAAVTIACAVPILTIRLESVLGQTVLDVANTHSPEVTIDLTKLPEGTYFARIETRSGEVRTVKLVKK